MLHIVMGKRSNSDAVLHVVAGKRSNSDAVLHIVMGKRSNSDAVLHIVAGKRSNQDDERLVVAGKWLNQDDERLVVAGKWLNQGDERLVVTSKRAVSTTSHQATMAPSPDIWGVRGAVCPRGERVGDDRSAAGMILHPPTPRPAVGGEHSRSIARWYELADLDLLAES